MKFNASKDMTCRILVWELGLLFAALAVGLAIPIYRAVGWGVSHLPQLKKSKKRTSKLPRLRCPKNVIFCIIMFTIIPSSHLKISKRLSKS